MFKYQGVVIINTSFSINGKRIGGNGDCFLIAEIGQAHEGSLGVAHAYIDAVSTTGADAVKFQTHIADAESSKYEQFRVSGFPQDSSRYEYWKRMEFTCSQWKELFEHAQEVGLIFLSSPFSIEAAELLEGINIPAWKVGSGEVSNGALMNYIINTGKPILLSTGMSDWKELDAEKLPSQVETTEYLHEARQKMHDWLDNHDDESILGPLTNHTHCGQTQLEFSLYILRHTLHHHGEMNALSVLEGGETDNWE